MTGYSNVIDSCSHGSRRADPPSPPVTTAVPAARHALPHRRRACADAFRIPHGAAAHRKRDALAVGIGVPRCNEYISARHAVFSVNIGAARRVLPLRGALIMMIAPITFHGHCARRSPGSGWCEQKQEQKHAHEHTAKREPHRYQKPACVEWAGGARRRCSVHGPAPPHYRPTATGNDVD
jgi:hypothetical protein